MRSENFLLVAITAQKFACRPSRLVGLRDPVLALDFDLAAAARLLERDRASSGDLQVATSECPDTSGRYDASVVRAREERW